MFFNKNVSISEKIKLKIVPTTTTLTVPWSGLCRKQKQYLQNPCHFYRKQAWEEASILFVP